MALVKELSRFVCVVELRQSRSHISHYLDSARRSEQAHLQTFDSKKAWNKFELLLIKRIEED